MKFAFIVGFSYSIFRGKTKINQSSNMGESLQCSKDTKVLGTLGGRIEILDNFKCLSFYTFIGFFQKCMLPVNFLTIF